MSKPLDNLNGWMLLDRVLMGLSERESFLQSIKLHSAMLKDVQPISWNFLIPWWVVQLGNFRSRWAFSVLLKGHDPEMLHVDKSKCGISLKMDRQIDRYQHLLLHK